MGIVFTPRTHLQGYVVKPHLHPRTKNCLNISKGAIRSRKWKERQCNVQMKKGNDLQNTTEKTND